MLMMWVLLSRRHISTIRNSLWRSCLGLEHNFRKLQLKVRFIFFRRLLVILWRGCMSTEKALVKWISWRLIIEKQGLYTCQYINHIVLAFWCTTFNIGKTWNLVLLSEIMKILQKLVLLTVCWKELELFW